MIDLGISWADATASGLRRLADRSVGGVRCGVGDGCEGVELALGQARAAARSVERLTASHAASSVARACPAAAAAATASDPSSIRRGGSAMVATCTTTAATVAGSPSGATGEVVEAAATAPMVGA